MADTAGLPLFGAIPMLRDSAPEAPRRREVDTRKPRYYQERAITQALADVQDARATLAFQATGTGKTFTAAQFIKARLPLGPAVWINERENLVRQMRGELSAMLGMDVFVEMGDIRAPSGARVVVASVQSLSQDNRLASYPRDYFKTIVFDEAHHSVSPTYRKVEGHFSHAKILGLTASPKRADGVGMDVLYERTCIEYPIGVAMGDGYLVPFRIEFAGGIDLSGFKGKRGDFGDDELADAMGEKVIRGMADKIMASVPTTKGVFYLPRVDLAHVMAAELNRQQAGCAMAVDGTLMDPQRKREILAAHKRGDFPHLVNVGVVTEGHDDAGIVYIGCGRPTKSISRYIQELGRPLRPGVLVDQWLTPAERRAGIAASWKPRAIVFDFVGNAGKHDIASPIDVLAGEEDDAETVSRAKDILREDGTGDAEGALTKARTMRTQEQLEQAAKVARVKGAAWKWKGIDPFRAFGMDGPEDVARGLNSASSGQRSQLWRMGIEVPQQLTRDDAQRIIRAAKAREKRDLAPYLVVKQLARHGVDATRMYRGQAIRIRDTISREHRGWTPPPDVLKRLIAGGRHPGEE